MQRFWLALLVTLALHGVFQRPADVDRSPQSPQNLQSPQPTLLPSSLSATVLHKALMTGYPE